MTFYDFILQFADRHWFITACAVISMCSTVYLLVKAPFFVLNRFLRHRDIKAHGWPTNPLMDADGDIVHPDGPK